MKIPVALQLYSVRDDMANDFEGTLRAVAAMGYRGVEFAGLFDRTPAEVRAICEKYYLAPISAHVGIGDLVKDPEGVLGAYHAIGCRFVAIPSITREMLPGGPEFAETRDNILKIGRVAADLGITLQYHNHDFEFENTDDGRHKLDALYESVPADLLKTQLDLCWVQVGGEDPASYLRKYTGRAPTAHFKDYAGAKGNGRLYKLIDRETEGEASTTFELRPLGEGSIDWPQVVAAAYDAGVEWAIIEQDEPSMGKTPLELAEISLRYLESL